jgi:aspartyl/asparaginyl-tRNA synthetase
MVWYKQDSKNVNNSTYSNNEKHSKYFRHEILKFRNSFFFNLRKYMRENDFQEMNFPSIVSCPTDPVYGKDDELFRIDWYGQQAYLAQSAQIHKQLAISDGWEKIYSIAPFFRKEERVSKRHLAESWSLDVEMSGVQSQRDLISHISEMVSDTLRDIDSKIISDKEINYQINQFKNLPIISYREAKEILCSSKYLPFKDSDLGPEKEFALAKILKKKYDYDIFAIEKYPSTVKKFYVHKLKNNETATFDIIYKGWEIVSGARRSADITEVINGAKSFNIDLKEYKEYLNIFDENLPPHGGFGLGLDRIIAKILNIDDIRYVVPHPRAKGLGGI